MPKISFSFSPNNGGLQVIDIPILFLHAEDDWVVPYRSYIDIPQVLPAFFFNKIGFFVG